MRERATADAANRFVIRITGPAQSVSTTSCFLRLRARVVGGGIMRYCVEAFHGRPGADATVRDRGTMTFVLPDGTLRAAVRITQRFAADGRHARQHLHGTLVGGGGRFRNARGSIVGGGTDVEHPPGQVVSSRLRYVVDLR